MEFESLSHKHISDKEFEEWVRMRQPYVATFEITPQCNFRCVHCYLGIHREEQNELSYEQILMILDELEKAGVLHLAITGGECTLRKDFCDIFKYAKQKGFLVTVFTNASHITNEILRIFDEFPPFTLEISLYGASDDTYFEVTEKRRYKEVLINLNKLKKHGIHFTLKTPLIIQNQRDKDLMEKIANEFNQELVIGFAMSPTIDKELYPTKFALGLVPRFLQEIKNNIGKEVGFKSADIENLWGKRMDKGEFVPQFICNPGVNDVFIDYLGNVCPCVAYRNRGIKLLGSERSFKEIWNQFVGFKEIPADKNNECIRCDSRYFCSICIGDQENVFGDINRIPWDVCTYARARKMYYKDKIEINEIISFLESAEKQYSQGGSRGNIS